MRARTGPLPFLALPVPARRPLAASAAVGLRLAGFRGG